MRNLDKLLKWETHDSRMLYAYKESDAQTLRFNIFRSQDERLAEGNRWYIERNHYGFPVFMTGVKLNDPEKKKLGISALDYGISRQLQNGSFSCDDAHHSAAFFLEALGRFVLLSGVDSSAASRIEPCRDALRKGVTWFHKRSVWNDDWWRDTFHHRFFLNSAVLFLSSEAVQGMSGSVLEQAYAWMAEGMRRQEEDGAITEFGGHDTGYQSLSITFASGVLMACTLHPDFHAKLDRCARKAVSWILGRVREDGIIDDSGNSRMGPNSGERNRETGEPKAVKYYETAFALYGAGLALDDERCFRAVERIMAAYEK